MVESDWGLVEVCYRLHFKESKSDPLVESCQYLSIEVPYMLYIYIFFKELEREGRPAAGRTPLKTLVDQWKDLYNSDPKTKMAFLAG